MRFGLERADFGPVRERRLLYEVYLVAQKLDTLIAQACEAAGVTLVEQDMFRAGKRKTLRLYIDKPEGVSIDDCTNVSRHLSDAPLKSVADFTRNIGRFVRVTRSTGKPVTGKLKAADEENLTLTLKGNAGDVVVPRSEVLVAKVDVQI